MSAWRRYVGAALLVVFAVMGVALAASSDTRFQMVLGLTMAVLGIVLAVLILRRTPD